MGRKKILMIDDEIDFGRIVKMALELYDNTFDVHLATSGKEGLKKALALRPDAILLDVMMPQMDGFEVLKRLKENMKTAPIPVIMLTAKTDDDSKLQAAELYNEEYLTKPIETPVLKEKIEAVIRRASPG